MWSRGAASVLCHKDSTAGNANCSLADKVQTTTDKLYRQMTRLLWIISVYLLVYVHLILLLVLLYIILVCCKTLCLICLACCINKVWLIEWLMDFCHHAGRAPGDWSKRSVPGHLQHEEERGTGITEGSWKCLTWKCFFSPKVRHWKLFFWKKTHFGMVDRTHTVCTSWVTTLPLCAFSESPLKTFHWNDVMWHMSHIKKTLTVCLCLQGENGKAVVEVRHLEASFFSKWVLLLNLSLFCAGFRMEVMPC